MVGTKITVLAGAIKMTISIIKYTVDEPEFWQ